MLLTTYVTRRELAQAMGGEYFFGEEHMLITEKIVSASSRLLTWARGLIKISSNKLTH